MRMDNAFGAPGEAKIYWQDITPLARPSPLAVPAPLAALSWCPILFFRSGDPGLAGSSAFRFAGTLRLRAPRSMLLLLFSVCPHRPWLLLPPLGSA